MHVDYNICAQTWHSVSGLEHKHGLELSSLYYVFTYNICASGMTTMGTENYPRRSSPTWWSRSTSSSSYHHHRQDDKYLNSLTLFTFTVYKLLISTCTFFRLYNGHLNKSELYQINIKSMNIDVFQNILMIFKITIWSCETPCILKPFKHFWYTYIFYRTKQFLVTFVKCTKVNYF